MHRAETVGAALALHERGCTAGEAARELDLPPSTVCTWLRRRPQLDARPSCPVCRVAHPFDELGASYVYLLGLYLGDGCLSEHARRVFRLRIVLDVAYPGIIADAVAAIADVRRRPAHVMRRESACVQVSSYWRACHAYFPSTDREKAPAPIALVDWQDAKVRACPDQLLRGLIHSDGWRFISTGRKWASPRYAFSNRSTDIREILCSACDELGVRWTTSGDYEIYVSRKRDVALLDDFIGPKR